MYAVIKKIEQKYQKPKVVDVRSGDTVRVHQQITEGSKTRVQVFEGLVIRTSKMGSLQARILVRRIASGVGVEKSFLLHSPNVQKIEVTKRAKVRRNYLSYMRQRSGKSARLSGKDFDQSSVNDVSVPEDTSKAAKEAERELSEETIEETKQVEAEAKEKTTEEPTKTDQKPESTTDKPVAEKADEKQSEEKTDAKAKPEKKTDKKADSKPASKSDSK